jgi:tripartite-type tricarboxylate transporter receptor subunit TctC
MFRRAAALLLISLLAAAATAQAIAQPYPAKPIRIVVPFPAGGNIGAEAVAKSAADGYTLVMGSVGTHAVNVSLFAKLPYDPVADFAPIALVAETDALLVVHPSVPAHTMARVDMLHIPYKGNSPAITDLLAGQTALLFATMPTVLPHAKAGKLRALATCGAVRAVATPELPTVGEAALPSFDVTNWIGLFAPAGTPADIVRRLNVEVLRIMRSPDMQGRLAGEGARFVSTTPQQFGAYVKAEIAKWAPVVKASGARAD